LHEKPFAGVNGSGKHNNWSIVGPDGKNWFAPGDTPHDDAKFLFMLVAVIKAVDIHSALIRSSAATAANDHRLGGNEAPPAILSIYLGDQLEDIVYQILTGGTATKSKKRDNIEVGLSTLPKLPADVSDRNRTSPFAFTGNKFEFRMVGSSQSCSWPNTVLNLALANALDILCGELETKLCGKKPSLSQGHTKEFHTALQSVLLNALKLHRRIIFNGDSYIKEWATEARKRGLPNQKTTPEALEAENTPEAIQLFEKYNILKERELRSRYEIHCHIWEKIIALEGGCALDLAKTFILPAALQWEKELADVVSSANAHSIDTDNVRWHEYKKMTDATTLLIKSINVLEKAKDSLAIRSATAELRVAVDTLEAIIPDRIWPFPCYGEMFFRYD